MIPNINPKNFVAPAPIPQPTPQPQITVLPRADTLLTRQDVMGAHRALLAAYEQQQADIADGWGGDAPSAQRAAAQGSTGMYLGTTVALTAVTTGGIALIAWLAGAGLAWALAGWVAATGIVALLLTRAQHAAELRHSQIGLALLVAESSYDLLAAAQDGHLALLAEERADARAARAAQDARQLAAAQAWQHARQPQHPQQTPAAAPAPAADSRRPQHPQPTATAAAAEPDDADDIPAWIRRPPQRPQRAPQPQPTAQPEPQPERQPEPQPERQPEPQPERQPERPAWADALLDWAATLHDGGLGDAGLITRATPWAARSPWPAPAKAAMLAVVTSAPAIITPAADGKGGGRYRLDTVAAPSSDALLAMLTVRLGTVGLP